jgi:hypothetical protein
MDKIAGYRSALQRVLAAYAEIVARRPTPGVETLLAFDESRDQYLWLQVGWTPAQRVHGVTVHARIVDGKIRIEQDWTEDGITTDLLQAGIPPEDIVLAFHEPLPEAVPESLTA